jgi:hypothetical protein
MSPSPSWGRLAACAAVGTAAVWGKHGSWPIDNLPQFSKLPSWPCYGNGASFHRCPVFTSTRPRLRDGIGMGLGTFILKLGNPPTLDRCGNGLSACKQSVNSIQEGGETVESSIM